MREPPMTSWGEHRPQPEDLPRRVVGAIDQQAWLDPPGDTLQNAIKSVYASAGKTGRRIQDALHGTWLGHALHPAMVSVPIGAWALAALLDVLDATGRRQYRPAADMAVAVGLGGAAAAAASGLTDWQHTQGKARRVGLVHAALNGLATGLYLVSWAARRRGRRTAARTYGWAGLMVSMGAAYLGGDLVGRQIGVDHTAGLTPPTSFTPTVPLEALEEGQPHRAEAAGTPLLLVRRAGSVIALVDRCAHWGGPLSEGTIEADTVTCPWHGSCFSLRDGRVLTGPSAYAQPSLETRVSHGVVHVRLPAWAAHAG